MTSVETPPRKATAVPTWRFRWVAAIGLAALIVTVALILRTGIPGQAFTPTEAGFVVGDSAVGDQFTDGFALLRLESVGETVRLESVEFLGDVEGLALLDSRVGTVGVPDSPVPHDYDPDHPPETSRRREVRDWIAGFDDLRPLSGAVLRGSDGRHHELVLGIEVLEPGVWERTGLRITYVQDGLRRRQDLGYGLVVCTPEGLVGGRCTDGLGHPLRQQ